MKHVKLEKSNCDIKEPRNSLTDMTKIERFDINSSFATLCLWLLPTKLRNIHPLVNPYLLYLLNVYYMFDEYICCVFLLKDNFVTIISNQTVYVLVQTRRTAGLRPAFCSLLLLAPTVCVGVHMYSIVCLGQSASVWYKL